MSNVAVAPESDECVKMQSNIQEFNSNKNKIIFIKRTTPNATHPTSHVAFVSYCTYAKTKTPT
jgi:glucosamine 6-phosphate synthetase-like amidotransferase/phosphosugar isomerase protein